MQHQNSTSDSTTKFTDEEIEKELAEKKESDAKDQLQKKYYDQNKSDVQKTINHEDFDLKK